MGHVENANVTIRDVASRAGVSIGTVSRALKNQPGLTEETRQQVLQAAMSLGYNTENLRPAKLRRVSFLTSRLLDLPVNAFYSPVLHGVEEACQDEEIVLSYTALRAGDKAIEIVRRHEADGLLCVGYFEPKLLERINAIGVPIVLIDHFVTGFTAVNMDNFDGAYKAVKHLLGMGRKRIAFIGGQNHYSIQQRAKGFRQALFDAGIPADPALEVLCDPIDSHLGLGARTAMQQLLGLPVRPDAVFVFNDQSAQVAMSTCLEAGVRIPEDIAFVGFDDIDSAAHSEPPLSTVRVNKELLGKRGLEALLERRQNQNIIVEGELIVRASSDVNATVSGRPR
jgi:LacI family transcriptional regulator, repressor for deo operon, udp, cdd, tsx, nupC, and nupG